MPTQRFEGNRVEERVGEGERERERGGERERKSALMWERKRESARFGSAFYMFLPPPGPALCKLGLARSAVCST